MVRPASQFWQIKSALRLVINKSNNQNLLFQDSSAIWDKDVPLMATEILSDCNQEEVQQCTVLLNIIF